LVRERSRVQSSLAAPLNALEIKASPDNALPVPPLLDHERVANIAAEVGEIRGSPFCGCSAPPQNETAAPAGYRDGESKRKIGASDEHQKRADAAIAAGPPICGSTGRGHASSAIIDEALCQGKANKIIAYELNMCESTVKVHVRNVMKRCKQGAEQRPPLFLVRSSTEEYERT
jgi:hypothetical protein